MDTDTSAHLLANAVEPEGGISILQLCTWLGEGRRHIAWATLAAVLLSCAVAFLLPPVYTARTSLLPPGAQQQGASAAALAAIGSLSGLMGAGAKTPDDLYVALLRSDTVLRGLDERFKLKERYNVRYFETLRKVMPTYVRVTSDKKAGLIALEVDDEEPEFAAKLANAHLTEITKILSRLAVSEAQQRRIFFDKQLKETKENLVRAETELRAVQERSGIIVLDKQAEAVIAGAIQVRSAITEREVRLRVLRMSSTDQNPDVLRLESELKGLRSELSRMESRQGPEGGSAVDVPMGRLPEASVTYVRARREVKLQETLLEAMVRQLESAKLDEAKEGPLIQQVDSALPPDYKSKPPRALIIALGSLGGLLLSALGVIAGRYRAQNDPSGPQSGFAWSSLKTAWRWSARGSPRNPP